LVTTVLAISLLEEFLCGDSFWVYGYFAQSLRWLHEKAVKKYIQN
jgi:REP element-mobilizing transposase RayT